MLPSLMGFEALFMAEPTAPFFHHEISSTASIYPYLHLQIFLSDQDVKAPLFV